jgi:magnesium transporter
MEDIWEQRYRKMRRLAQSRAAKEGLPPGALVHIGTQKIEQTKVKIIAYDAHHIQEPIVNTIADCYVRENTQEIVWTNVVGLHETAALGQLGTQFGLHPLVVEDILNTEQRPKMEDYDEYIFVVLKSLRYNDTASDVPVIEQISLVLGPNYILSFQEREGSAFAPIRERIRSNKGRVRAAGADYLLYALLDLIVDHYFVVLEQFGDRIAALEEDLITEPTTETLHHLHHLKREMVFLRKAIWPLRDVLSGLTRSESPLIQESTRLYLRDVYDHTIQIIETVEIFRDMLSGLLDIYLSSISNRMNEVMKVLTIISTVFIPLTFIAGIYGMNFTYMPELGWSWAYPVVWGMMIIIALAMVIYFRSKKWL